MTKRTGCKERTGPNAQRLDVVKEKRWKRWEAERGKRTKRSRCFSMQLICILISKQETNQLIQLCLSLFSLSHRFLMYHPSILPSNSGLYDFSHFLLLCSNHPSICPPSNHFLFHSLLQLKVEPLYRDPPWTLLSHTNTQIQNQMIDCVRYIRDRLKLWIATIHQRLIGTVFLSDPLITPAWNSWLLTCFCSQSKSWSFHQREMLSEFLSYWAHRGQNESDLGRSQVGSRSDPAQIQVISV